MAKSAFLLVAMAFLLALGPADNADARVHVHIGIAIPPPPAVVFEHEPEVVVIPRTHVSYVPNLDYDLYQYGGYWYIDRGGYWYRAHDYHGPFAAVRFEAVPRAVVVVPGKYHHHRLHPGHGRHFHH